MSHNDLEYYRRRAADERAMAKAADSAKAAAVHQQLACFYESLVELEEETEPVLEMVEATLSA